MMPTMKRIISATLITAAFGVAMTLSSCGEPGSKQPSAKSPEARLQELDRNLQAVETSARTAPRDRWDVDHVVTQVGRDPRKLFAWVRSNASWIPYRGVLRGPAGVLMDGQGNSLDQALLLATLLEKAGHSVRLAHGELSQKQIGALLPDLVARHATSFGASGAVDTGLAQKLQTTAAQFMKGGDGATQIAEQNQEAGRILSRLDARVADQTGRLLRVVRKPDPAEEWSKMFGAAVTALQDHWWVQRRDGDRWVDMDLFSAGSDGAGPLAHATETVLLKDLAGGAPYHEIALRVIAEQWSVGTLHERIALEHVLRPADLIGHSITLQFWPTAPLTDPQPVDESKSDFRAAALDQHEWAAMMLVGGEVISAAVLPESGDDPDAPPKGGAMGALSRGFGSLDPPKKTSSSGRSALSAVWLEYEIRVPGEETRKIRRAVFDLIGSAARAAGAPAKLALNETHRLTRSRSLMMRTEILPIPCRIAPEFVAHLFAASLLGNREMLRSAMQSDHSIGPGAANDLAQRSAPTVSSLYALALAQVSHNDARIVYINRPALLTSHSYPKLVDAGVAVIEATDIVANEVGISLVTADGFAARLAQGVRDTNAESLLLGSGTFGNAADAFAVSSTWVALTSPDETAVERLQLSGDVRRRILEDLIAGYTVVAPTTVVPMKSGPFAGWWRIDPVSGHTLGFGENGWGVAATEHSANSSRAGATGRLFINASKRFVAGFAGMYGWCLAPLIHDRVGSKGLILGLKLSVADSVGECVGDALFVGALATLPLVALTVNRSGRVGRVPAPPETPNTSKPPHPPKPPEPPCRGGKNKTEPMPVAKTDPDLRTTQPDLSKTAPDLSKTQPDLSKTAPDLSKTQPDYGDTAHDPSSSRKPAEPEFGGWKTNEGPRRAPEPGASPDAHGKKTPNPVENEPGGGNQTPTEWNGRSPPTTAQLAKVRADALNAQRAFSNKRSELATAHADAQSPAREATARTGEWVRYRSKGNPDGLYSDPANYDPAVEKQLKEKSDLASQSSERAAIKWRKASDDFQAAEKKLEAKEAALRRAEAAAKGPKGECGL